MTHLHLQVDVIDSQYSALIDKIKTTRDFEAVRLAHDQFLSALLSQSFVHMKPVSTSRILGLRIACF